MEHRWGQRVTVDLPVRIIGHPFSGRPGRLLNFSVSGAWITVDLDLRVLSRLQIAIDYPHRPKHEVPLIAAYVARKFKGGFGLEWCEFAPSPISGLLRSFTARRYVRLRRPEPRAAVTIGRLSPALLRHAT
ncbi:MAG: hypothetical protein M3O06_03955 [Pseudomonadota bacterium]|nr:hypothetical protein [Pseudomonadota bacterium]